MEEMRVVTVRLEIDGRALSDLKDHAATAARFANEWLNYFYADGLAHRKGADGNKNYEPLSGNLPGCSEVFSGNGSEGG